MTLLTYGIGCACSYALLGQSMIICCELQCVFIWPNGKMAKNPGCIVSHSLNLQVLVSLPQVQLPHLQQALDLTQTGYNLAGH